MSINWNDLVSQSDIFFTVLPLYKGSSLQDKIEGNLTTNFDAGKFAFNVSSTDGKLATKVSGKECFKRYWGIELAGKLQNKPQKELSIKFDDKLLPMENLSLLLKFVGSKVQESFSGELKYQDRDVVGSLGLTLRNSLFGFGYASQEILDKVTPKVTYSVLGNIFESLYVGFKGNYNLAQKDQKSVYDLSFIGAVKTNELEAGIYNKTERKDEKGDFKLEERVGVYASAKKDNLVLRVQAAHKHNSNDAQYRGFSFTAGVSAKADDGATYVGQVQVSPDTTLSVGFEKQVAKYLKLSVGYAHVVAFGNASPKLKNNAFSFKLDLSH